MLDLLALNAIGRPDEPLSWPEGDDPARIHSPVAILPFAI